MKSPKPKNLQRKIKQLAAKPKAKKFKPQLFSFHQPIQDILRGKENNPSGKVFSGVALRPKDPRPATFAEFNHSVWANQVAGILAERLLGVRANAKADEHRNSCMWKELYDVAQNTYKEFCLTHFGREIPI